MEALLPSTATTVASAPNTTTTRTFSAIPSKNFNPNFHPLVISFSTKTIPHNTLLFPFSTFSSSLVSTKVKAEASSTFASPTLPLGQNGKRYWMVLVEHPPQQLATKPQIVDYYVRKLEKVLGSERDAQMCIYDASCDTRFGFCCDIDDETAHELRSLPGVLSVKPDPDLDSTQKDYSSLKFELDTESNSPLFDGSTLLFPAGTTKRWLVRTDRPAIGAIRKAQVVDYYVQVLMRILRNEKDAQMCIYHVSWESNYGFCCELDDECARELAAVPGVLLVEQDENFSSDYKKYGGLPGVLSVKPDPDLDSTQKDYSSLKFEMDTESNSPLFDGSTLLFPAGTTKRWLVRTDRPAIGAIRKAQVVDYYVQVLMRILKNEKDAQMCIYHVSWESNYGFCCELDDECARELAAVPGVLSVEQNENFSSDYKKYGGENLRAAEDSLVTSPTSEIKTKKLFVTGLSFYTSEKTLHSAFEGFGEIVEVKIIMDKISKRSKGYAFVEYTTEEAASTALREMNGKIINGWMITVDVAKKNPPKYSRGQPRPTS